MMSRKTWEQYRLILDPTARERRDPSNEISASWPRQITAGHYADTAEIVASSREDPVDSKKAYLLELVYLRLNRPTLFVESAQIARAIYGSKMEINYEVLISRDPLRQGYGNPRDECEAITQIMSVAWPSDLAINGMKPLPVLTAITHGVVFSLVRLGFARFARFSVRSQENIDEVLTRSEEELDHLTCDYKDFPRGLSARLQLTAALALRTFIYAGAEGACVTNGFPHEMRERERRVSACAESNSYVASVPEHLRSSPSMHWRRWHIRTLRAERYKRDAFGGYRTVLVRDAVVGRGDPKTLER